ncbi:MAG: hypothetical protein ACTSXF_03385 [Promethearchaeota archaeon]
MKIRKFLIWKLLRNADAGFIAVVCLIVFSSLYFFQLQVNTPNQDALEHSPQLFASSTSQLNLVIDSYANNNSQICVKLSWSNLEGVKYFNLYRYGADPLSPTTENITLLENASVSEYLDIPNIGHPYYMVRVYYANGTYADSNIVDVDLGEIPMFINPEYEIEGESVSFSVWCKENVSIVYIYLLNRFRKEGDDWKCIEDIPGERSLGADSRSVMENNWTRYEWGPEEVKYSTYVWFNFYHLKKNVYWRPDRYANGTFNYEKWGRTGPVYVFKTPVSPLLFLFMAIFYLFMVSIYIQIFIGISIYFDFKYGKKARIITYLMSLSVIGSLYSYFELNFGILPTFEINFFGHYVDKYSYGLILNRSLLIPMVFSLCQLLGLIPFLVIKVKDWEDIKQNLIEKNGEKNFTKTKREINLALIQIEIFYFSYFFSANSFLLNYGAFNVFFLNLDFAYVAILLTLGLFLTNFYYMLYFDDDSFIFFNKIEKVDNFNHYWGELNQYYEDCKKAFKLYRKMLIPVLIMFLALFISNYILFKNWLVLMNT